MKKMILNESITWNSMFLAFILSISMFLLSVEVMAQDLPTSSASEPVTSQVIPPSPTAAGFSKYGNIPVSYNTGVPNISIPLYTARSGALSMPISLSYHAGGLKVQEEAQWTGLNWSLNAGGVITRTIRGIPDEFSGVVTGYFDSHDQITSLADNINSPTNTTFSEEEQVLMYNIYNGLIDSEPDEYSFNINGRSGKMFFSPVDNSWVTIPHSSLKITGGPILGGFTITDESGVVYTFNVKENSYYQSNFLGLEEEMETPYTQSWYMNRINTANGTDEITLSYCAPYEVIDKDQKISYNSIVFEQNENNTSQQPRINVSRAPIIRRQMVKLAQINFDNGQIKLVKNETPDRNDIPGEYKLDAIELYEDDGTTLKKSFALTYRNEGGNNRLQLLSVQERGIGGITKPPHSFRYYDDFDMPDINSYSQDHWGYFNGQPNTVLYPERLSTVDYVGANRESSFNIGYVRSGTLAQITYPTGGSTTFDYEPNTVYDPNFQGEQLNIREFTNQVAISTAGNLSTPSTQNITLENDQKVSLRITYSIDNGSAVGDPILDDGGGYVDVSIFNTDSQVEVFSDDFRAHQDGGLSFNRKLDLPAGNYEMRAIVIVGENNDHIGSAPDITGRLSMTYTNPLDEVESISEYLVGGQRIQRITDIDPNGSPDQVRVFSYQTVVQVDGVAETVSSGRRWSVPSYVQKGYREDELLGFCAHIRRDLTTILAINQSQGRPVAYTEVKVSYGENAENGSTTYRYTMPRRYEAGFPFPPSYAINEYTSNLLENETHYNQQGIVKQSTSHFYTYHNNTDHQNHLEISAIKMGLAGTKIQCRSPLTFGQEYLPYVYPVSTYWFYIHETEQVVYEGEKEFSTVQRFSYGNPDHLQATRIESTRSDGGVQVVKTKYPQDYVSVTSIGSLISSHIVNAPIEIQSWVSNSNEGTLKMVSGRIIDYDLISLQPSKVYLFETKVPVIGLNNETKIDEAFNSLISDSRYELRTEYFYDTGARMAMSLQDGFPTSYMWGYDNSLPIAQSSNTELGTFFYTSFENDGNSNEGKTGQKSQINGFSKELTGLEDGVYELTWWQKTAGNWSLHENQVNVTGGTYSINISGHVDEVRFYPYGAQVTTYTHDPLFGPTDITDFNNQSTKYQYDGFGRLERIKDFEGNVLQEYKYHFQNN